MGEWLTCKFNYDEKISFAMQQNQVPVINSIEVTNHRDDDLTDIHIVVTSNPEFAEAWRHHLSVLPSGETTVIDHINLSLSTQYLAALEEQISGYFKIEMLQGDKIIFTQTLPVHVLSYDEWPGLVALPEIIASFVTPNRPFVASILKEASQLLESKFGYRFLDGYQSQDPNRVVQQLSAIYAVLQAKNITYTNPPASFELHGQKVRFPDTIAEQGLGTCFDLTLLLAACAEAVGINPIIVFFKGHALPAFWLVDHCCSESMQDDPSIITKHSAKGVSEMIVLESTLLTQAHLPFSEAVKLGMDKLESENSFQCLIDIKRCRISQIKPLPVRRLDSDGIQLDEEPVKNSKLALDYQEVSVVSTDFSDTDGVSPKADKILYWQRQLLDLSLRNSLLNYKFERKGIPLITPEISHLEDTLVEGDQLSILHKPRELNENIRDFLFYDSQNGNRYIDDLIKSDFQHSRLRSMLSESELKKKLIDLYRKAKREMEESGANTLYVALGFLKWYESPTSDVARYAPILLLPIDLIRKSVQTGYSIQARDEEIQINISLIEMLKQRFGIDGSHLYNIPKDEHGADVSKIFTSIRRLIMDMKGWDLVETASIGIFSFAKFVMYNDLVNHSDDLRKNKVVNSIIENKRTWEMDDSMNVRLTTENEDTKELLAPLSADSSQTEALIAATNNSFVLHGPPGTGKSQTITNMIANTLAEGKTVLFVAEKLAALNVVQNRLQQLGLDLFSLELHSNKTNKKDLFAQFERIVELERTISQTEWQKQVDSVKTIKTSLNQYVKALHKKRTLGSSLYEMITRYSELKDQFEPFRLDEEQVIAADEEIFTEYKDVIKRLAVAGENLANFTRSPWLRIENDKFSLKLKDSVSATSRQIIAAYKETKKNLRSIAEQLGLQSENETKAWASVIKSLLQLLTGTPDVNVNLIAIHDFDKTVERIDSLIETGEKRDESMEKLEKTFSKEVLQLNIRELLGEIRLANDSWFLKKMIGRNKIVKSLTGYLKSGQTIDKEQLQQQIESMQEINELQAKLDAETEMMNEFFPDTWNKTQGDWEGIRTALRWAKGLRDHVKSIASIDNHHFDTLVTAFVKQIESISESVVTETADQLEQMMNDEATLQSLLKTDETDEPHWLDSLYTKATAYVEHIDSLKDGCHFAAIKQEMLEKKLNKPLEAVMDGDVKPTDLPGGFEVSFLRLRIDYEVSHDAVLADFYSAEWREMIDSFRQLDEQLMETAKQEVYARLLANMPELSKESVKSSEPGILLRAIRSKGRGVTIRQLFRRIPNLLKRVKPCMLMSPLSVAQFLDPELPPFDLVIFDEASQLPTSEAVGAMARGKNVVVVGDPNQLPPTTFFKSTQVNEDDSEELQDLESVLDDCLALDMPQKHLRWHYRSEHESLISFSNRNYYKGELVTFPSTDSSRSRVSFRKVEGIYERGKGRHNVKEAEAVVDEVFSRLMKDPERSIGVVTFSQPQQTLIEDMLEEKLKVHHELEPFFTSHVEEPVFVKNLENVQGDERDVILFSIGYGPDEKGYLAMNFGPLNREGGWRRLNVAVSRAKYEMVIFSSFEPEQINLSRTKARGAKDLRAFMEYAQRGKLPATTFEDASEDLLLDQVANALRGKGCKVDLSVGDSRYKVDIAIRDSNAPDEYVAAVQLDGFQYVSATTTRDRDKLRENMLRKLGWKVIRVSSLDWWHNREKEVERIIEESRKPVETTVSNPERKTTPKIIKLPSTQPSPKIASAVVVNPLERPYEKADLEPIEGISSALFYEKEGETIVRSQLRQVVATEAPISFRQLARRVSHAWGFNRSGNKIEQVLMRCIRAERFATSKSGKTLFIWVDDEQKNTYKTWRTGKVHSREINDICHQEVANAMKYIVRNLLSLSRDDLIRETAKTFGFSRVGPQVSARLQLALDRLNSANVVKINEDQFVSMK